MEDKFCLYVVEFHSRIPDLDWIFWLDESQLGPIVTVLKEDHG